jgi:hypothetical protein
MKRRWRPDRNAQIAPDNAATGERARREILYRNADVLGIV